MTLCARFLVRVTYCVRIGSLVLAEFGDCHCWSVFYGTFLCLARPPISVLWDVSSHLIRCAGVPGRPETPRILVVTLGLFFPELVVPSMSHRFPLSAPSWVRVWFLFVSWDVPGSSFLVKLISTLSPHRMDIWCFDKKSMPRIAANTSPSIT